MKPSIKSQNIERAAYDFLLTISYEKLFERFPNLRLASVENGSEFLPDLFRKLRQTAFQKQDSYFRKYTQVSEEEAMDYARGLWRTINKPNLVENIAPTRGRATLVLRKGPDHTVQRLRLRKL